ncbi:hypothetical protein [Embleya sp. NPDC020630]|uniref:hypothetical protein n=1 Tax=Embleya sp. NPDC020630 TaxID=3363979 RepID=UPI0037A508C1
MPTGSTPQLTYSPTPRFLSAVTQGGKLSLAGRNRTGGSVTCSTVTFSFPQGNAATDLTAQDAEALGLGASPGWDKDVQNVGNSIEVTLSAPGGLVMANGDTVELHFDNLDTNGATGTVDVIVTEETEGHSTATTTVQVEKNPAGFVLADFRPDPYIVDPEHTTTDLTWRTTVPQGTTATYSLRCTGYAQPWDVTGKTTQHIAPPGDATCVLTATLQPGSGPQTRADLGTFVMVAGAAVAARTLAADTTVALLGRTDPDNAGIPGYTPVDARTATVAGDRFVAHTDGLLIANVGTLDAGREVHLHLALAVAPPGDEELYRMTTVADTRRQTAVLPVPAGSAVTVATSSPGGSVADPWYMVVLDWRPFGGGRLKPTP